MNRWPFAFLLSATPLLAAEKPPRPPIDVAAPAKTETATFALG